MNKEEIVALLNSVASPVCQIEAELGMPKTTLQKAIKGERRLPKKWALKLTEKYSGQKEASSLKSADVIVPENQSDPVSVDSINDIDKMFEEEFKKLKNKNK